MILLFDRTNIRLDVEQNPFDINFSKSLLRIEENMSFSMHVTQYGLSQHNRLPQDVEV